MKYWGLKLLAAAILIIIGYASPIVWLSISAAIWAVYLLALIASPLLIAASQNTTLAKTAKRTITVLGTMATGALISAPIVLFIWYSNR